MAGLTAERRERYRMAYVVGESDLVKLDGMITDAAGCAPQYSASLADSSTILFPNLETLLKFGNSTNREIQGIELSAKERNHIRVTLQDAEEDDTVLLTASGNDQDLYPFSGDFKAWREDVKASSSWFARIPPVIVTLSLGMGIWLSLMFAVITRLPKDAPVSLFLLLFAVAATTSTLITLGAIRAKAYLFPMSTIALGYGIKRSKKRVKIRNFIAGPIVLAIITSVVADYLFSLSPK